MFSSTFRELGQFEFPDKHGVRIQVMPVRIGDPDSLPDQLDHWRWPFMHLCALGQFKSGNIGYLTIDEKLVVAGNSHRRGGPHADFWRRGGNHTDVGYDSERRPIQDVEMVMVSDIIGCRAWKQSFSAYPGLDGDCSHLIHELDQATEVHLEPNLAYGLNRLTVHESMPFKRTVFRRFVRLVDDILVEHFTNWTQNPLGIRPPAHVRIPGPRSEIFMAA